MRDIELEEVKECIKWYNALSKSYDELYGEEQKVKYRRLFKNVDKELGVVLDVGCGTGTLFEYLITSGFKVSRYICMDVSDKIVELALRKLGTFVEEGMLIDLIIADLAYPPFREEPAFDLIAMITVLKEDYNLVSIVSKYVSRVRRGGYLLYTVIRKELRDDELRYEDAYVVHS
ncbi:MAG: class I SAM-dependent methyltransferase [Sulfolobales archaeon]